MAGGGLLALLDDIATVLDDVAVMSKIAVKKTAGIAGDDLAVGAGTVTNADPSRELPIVWAVAKGSFTNKLFLIPGALALNFVAPWVILPLLMAGGAFLCYEGVEKVLHAKISKKDGKQHEQLTAAFLKSPEALKEFEKKKIKGAIKTDLILSAEIVAVTLGAVAASAFATQLAVLAAIGVLMTVGIYGLVGTIVKLDDIGLHLTKKTGATMAARAIRKVGNALVTAAPKIMKALSVVGTAAMLLVGGELILHGIPAAEHLVHALGTVGGMLASSAVGAGVGLASIPLVKAVTAGLSKAAAFLKKKPRAPLPPSTAPVTLAPPADALPKTSAKASLNEAVEKDLKQRPEEPQKKPPVPPPPQKN